MPVQDYPNFNALVAELGLAERDVFTPFTTSAFYSPNGLEATAPVFSGAPLQLPRHSRPPSRIPIHPPAVPPALPQSHRLFRTPTDAPAIAPVPLQPLLQPPWKSIPNASAAALIAAAPAAAAEATRHPSAAQKHMDEPICRHLPASRLLPCPLPASGCSPENPPAPRLP